MMKFENKIKLRFGFNIILLLLGISALGLGIVKNIQFDSEFQFFYYYVGTGGALIAVSLLLIRKNLSALTSKEKMQSLKVEERDERNILLAQKAGHLTFVTTTIGLYFLSLYLLYISSQLFEPIIFVCSALVLIYLLFYFIVRKTN